MVWDGTGLCLFQKRLERSPFASLWRNDGDVVTLTASELALFIEGCELVGHRKLSAAVVVPTPLGARDPKGTLEEIDTDASTLRVYELDEHAEGDIEKKAELRRRRAPR